MRRDKRLDDLSRRVDKLAQETKWLYEAVGALIRRPKYLLGDQVRTTLGETGHIVGMRFRDSKIEYDLSLDAGQWYRTVWLPDKQDLAAPGAIAEKIEEAER